MSATAFTTQSPDMCVQQNAKQAMHGKSTLQQAADHPYSAISTAAQPPANQAVHGKSTLQQAAHHPFSAIAQPTTSQDVGTPSTIMPQISWHIMCVVLALLQQTTYHIMCGVSVGQKWTHISASDFTPPIQASSQWLVVTKYTVNGFTVNVVIFAVGKFRENVGKTFCAGVIFTILLLFPS